GLEQPRPHEARLSSGLLYAALAATGELQRRADLQASSPGALTPGTEQALAAAQTSGALVNFRGTGPTVGCPNVFTGSNGQTNIRVNQDCSLRRQAEEVIAVNPTNPSNLIAGQNDSRVGFNHCGYDFSFDGGRTWGDMIPPFYNFILGDGHTAD